MLPRFSKHGTWTTQVWKHLFLFNVGSPSDGYPFLKEHLLWGGETLLRVQEKNPQKMRRTATEWYRGSVSLPGNRNGLWHPHCGPGRKASVWLFVGATATRTLPKIEDSHPSVLHKISCSISFFGCHLHGSIILLECNILNGWVCQSLFGEPIYCSRNHCSTWWETSVAIHKYSIFFEQDQHLISSPSRALQTRSLNLWSWWARGNNRIWMIILFRKWWLEPWAKKTSLVLQGTSKSPLVFLSHSQSQMKKHCSSKPTASTMPNSFCCGKTTLTPWVSVLAHLYVCMFVDNSFLDKWDSALFKILFKASWNTPPMVTCSMFQMPIPTFNLQSLWMQCGARHVHRWSPGVAEWNHSRVKSWMEFHDPLGQSVTACFFLRKNRPWHSMHIYI